MVRLQHCAAISHSSLIFIFQSHYGAIATLWDGEQWVVQRSAFNPTMVRLQRDDDAAHRS